MCMIHHAWLPDGLGRNKPISRQKNPKRKSTATKKARQTETHFNS